MLSPADVSDVFVVAPISFLIGAIVGLAAASWFRIVRRRDD